MGYHSTVGAALAAKLTAALPANVPVINVLAIDDAELQHFAAFVGLQRERIDFKPHPEINPETTAMTQPELWEWVLYVAGGAGEATKAGKGGQVDTLLETIRTALNAQRLGSDCGPLNIISESYLQQHGNGVVYEQRWRHERQED